MQISQVTTFQYTTSFIFILFALSLVTYYIIQFILLLFSKFQKIDK